ncbi:taste receptor type 2 member 9-like [Lissotriton helveticus]
MESELDMAYVIIVSIVSVIGMLASAFIVTLNLLDWAKGQSLNTCDFILMALGISCTFYQCFSFGAVYMNMLWCEDFYLNYISVVLSQLVIWTTISSFWLTTCLCIFYCVKIVDFNYRFFIWLKLRMSKVVPWLLLGSVLWSLGLSAPVYWDAYANADFAPNSTVNLTVNSTLPGGEVEWIYSYFTVLYFFGFVAPLLLATVSITLILASLCTHIQRMKETAAGFSQPRLKAHFGAARIVGSLLLIYIFLLVGEILLKQGLSPFSIFILQIINMSAIPAQSIILILGNTKLKQALLRLPSSCRK